MHPILCSFRYYAESAKENPDVIQPDLIVICDLEEYLDDTGYYMGIPTLVVEILSESTRRKDILTKLNLYMSSGICSIGLQILSTGDIGVLIRRQNYKR